MEEALYKGNSHDNGGIKVLVDGSKPIEVEGHEYLLCNKAMQSTKIFEFKNKTNKEILDEFHTYSTCEFKQNEAHSGDFIICKKVVLDTNKRNITGTIKEIVNIMQSEKGCRQSNDDVFKTGGEIDEKEVENQGSLNLMKWYIDWYKNISDKMNITLSLPNLLAPFIEKNVVIMDLFEKINQDIDAKTYLQEIIKKADEYKVTIYLEPMPRYKYFLKNIEKRKKISKEYLIEYYEKFGFKLTPNAQFMKRKFNGNEINIFDETKYDDNGKVCYWKTYTFNDSSISIDYCLDNFFKIDAIGTKEKSRRGGDASKLIDYVKEIALKNNFQKIDVYLPIDENTPRKEYSIEDYKKAVSFYKKNGFKFYTNSTVKMFCEVKADKLKTGGDINLKKLVEPVNELAIEINKLYNEWNKIKNDKDWKKWQESVKSKRYGTYKNKDILDILDNFEPKYPNDIIKKDWIIELHKALEQDLPSHLKGNVKVSDSEINELKARISEKTYKYALLLRPFDIGTYPKENFIGFIDDVKYPHGLIEYSQPIPLEKIKHYSLSPITEINKFDGKEFTYYEDLKAKAQILKNNSNIPYVKVTMFDENNEVSDEATMDAVNFMENVSSGRYKIISEKETLQGGAGDKKTIEDIAKKHNVSLDYAEQQLAKGIKIESEHTNDIEKQTEIAIDHLFEFIEYYNELEKMETNLKSKKEINYTELEPFTRQDWDLIETFKSADGNTKVIKFIWQGDFYEWRYSSTGSGGGIHISKYNSLQALKNPLTTSGTHETIYNTWNRYQTTAEGRYIEYSISQMKTSDFFGTTNKEITENKVSIKVEDYKNEFLLNKAIEKLIDYKGANRNDYNADEINFISYYSGYGGLGKYGTVGRELAKGLKYEFYTPDDIVKKMWGLAYKYGYGTLGDNSIFETSAGIGNFVKYAPKDVKVVCNEINKYSVKILEILYPDATIYHKYFEQNFITKDNKSMKSKIDGLDKYSLIIGNPPYGELTGKYIGMGEDAYTKAGNFCEYFITRSLDLLIKDGLLIYIVGAEQLNGGTLFLDSKMSKVKEIIFDKAHLIDAYRLPVKVFERTGVSSEILIFRKK
jgi:GNAT superfamily N-acetyltransferase